MVINIDILIIENIIINYFLMVVTYKILKIQKNFSSFLLPSFISSLYCLVLFLPNNDLLVSLPFKLLVVVFMNLLVIGMSSKELLLKASIVYMICTLVMGGLCVILGISSTLNYESFDLEQFSYKKIIMAMVIIYLIIIRMADFIRDRNILSNLIYNVEIITEVEKTKVKAFLDTGNELREPVTNLPVIIVEEQYFNNLKEYEKNLFNIPYKVVDGNKGYLQGFKPKEIKILSQKGFEKREAIICICHSKLSNSNEYGALLSRGIL